MVPIRKLPGLPDVSLLTMLHATGVREVRGVDLLMQEMNVMLPV